MYERFTAALIAFVEATRGDLESKNRLCPPNHQPNVPLDWLRGTLIGMTSDYRWSNEPDIAEWLERSRLDVSRGLRGRVDDPRVQQAFVRFATNVRSGRANLERFCSEACAAPASPAAPIDRPVAQ